MRAGIVVPAFAFAEVGGGISTSATFDRKRNTFQLHSPNASATKYFVDADFDAAIVFARMIVDGKEQGVRAFLVRVRAASVDRGILPGVRVGELGWPSVGHLVRTGWMRFYDMTIPRTALLNHLSDVDSKPVPLSALLAPISCSRMVSLCAAAAALGKALQVAQAWAVETRAAPSVMPLEYATTQQAVMSAHASLVAVHVIRNRVVLHLRGDDGGGGPHPRLAKAFVVHFVSVCQSQILALSQCMGADSLLAVTGFPVRLHDVKSLLHQHGNPAVEMLSLAQWLIKWHVRRYGGVMGALRYVTAKVRVWVDANPIASRRTSPDYLRSFGFQLRCLRYRVFVLCGNLLEDLSKVAVADDAEEVVWRTNMDAVLELARAFIELCTLKEFIKVEAQCTDSRALLTLQRCRSMFSLQSCIDWGMEFRNEAYMSAPQCRAVVLELGVVTRELLLDFDILLQTTTADIRDEQQQSVPFVERLLKAKL